MGIYGAGINCPELKEESSVIRLTLKKNVTSGNVTSFSQG
jgi:7-keto-8-aminopelargonate synthetase-like enzyme